MSSHPFTDGAEFLTMAHRGASMRAPANTWPAFELAWKMGANVIETDVHWTKDDRLVVCHDDVVDRVTEHTGRIRDLTYGELRTLDFGYRFTLDEGKTFPFRGKGVQIMTFDELLERLPDVRVNVDLKPKEPRVASFLRILDEHNAFHRVMLASFSHQTLVEARARTPRVATSASTREVVEFLLRIPSLLRLFGRDAKVPYLALQVPRSAWGRPLVNRHFVERAKAIGVAVHVWTVNDEKQMQELVEAGVDGIVTDCPDICLKVLHASV
ncbi:glycerophosphodiester phosphodiesterase [Alicyclobacillus fastidiosus]|uniref:Glycerophosphodiester phosphodiesterase n=1 Tax=Alicyclobacillus fastidiosus TaxID=392011 RepID=A0ABV5ADS8_9BACL|nr:glycerophosphodiester phosphodiesterase [Alicyclobacillus fastidiosus]WEH08543.1 glycerophosphodiester phosphodiesterase [Alicyclobacillus fastidiosus]